MRSLLFQRPSQHRGSAGLRSFAIPACIVLLLFLLWHYFSMPTRSVSIRHHAVVAGAEGKRSRRGDDSPVAPSFRLEPIDLKRSVEPPGSCVGGRQDNDHFTYYNPATGESDVEPKISPSFLNASVPRELRNLRLKMVSHSLLKASSSLLFSSRRRPARPWRRAVVGHHACEEFNVVLSYAVNYKTFLLRELVASFQQHASFCDFLVLVVDTAHEPLTSTVPWLSDNIVLIRREDYVLDDRYKGQPSTERIGIFRIWLEEEGVYFRYVLIIDARDTLFYGDPFLPFYQWKVDGLLATGELYEYRSETLNQISMKELLPSDPVSPFINSLRIGKSSKGLPVLNSGLFGGTISAVLDYVHNANYSLHEIGDPGTIIDQVLYMVLVTLMLPQGGFPHKIVVSSSSHGPYRHMLPQKGALAVTSQLTPVNCAGQPYVIQHQTDRCSLFDESRDRLAKADAALYRHYGRKGLQKAGVLRLRRDQAADHEGLPLKGDSTKTSSSRLRGVHHPSVPNRPRCACLKKTATVVLFQQQDEERWNITSDDVKLMEQWTAMFQRTFSALCDELLLVVTVNEEGAKQKINKQQHQEPSPAVGVDFDFLPNGPQVRVMKALVSSKGQSANVFAAGSPLASLLEKEYDCAAVVVDGRDRDVLLLRNVFVSLPSCGGRASNSPHSSSSKFVVVLPVSTTERLSQQQSLSNGSSRRTRRKGSWIYNNAGIAAAAGRAEHVVRLLRKSNEGGAQEEEEGGDEIFVCPAGEVCFDMASSSSPVDSMRFWAAYSPDPRADGSSPSTAADGRSGTFIVRCLVCVSTHDDADYSADGDHKKCDASFRVRMVNSTLS